MKTVTASPGIVLQLGRQGENNARQIVFDITDWKAEFGADGTAALLAQRPGETEPYPVDIVVSGSAVTWLVSAADTAKPGIYGQAELQYRIGEVVVKSAIWRTFVADSLGVPSPEPPEPQQAWVDQVLDAAKQVETATVNGPKIQNGTWWVWDVEGGKYTDTGVAAQGPEGPAGTSPTPNYINMLSDYEVDVVSAVYLAIAQGITEFNFPFPKGTEFFSAINATTGEIWLLMPMPMQGSGIYHALITGMSKETGGSIYWVDAKISVYQSGWLSGYLGISRSTIYVKITEAPGL